MSNKTTYYGNWVPKKLLIGFLLSTILFGAFSFLPVYTLIQIIFLIIPGICLVFLLYFSYAYVKFAANDGELQKSIHKIILDKLPEDMQKNVLDIGTGSGALAIGVAKKYPHAKITGIDYWGKGWDYAKEMCEKNATIEGVNDRIHFEKASAADLPFEDEEFDAAVSNFVFHEVRDAKNKRDVIQEALRIVKKGGVFSISRFISCP